jgi:hypothetical protein
MRLQVDTLRTTVGQLEVSAAAAEAEYNRQLARNKDELAALRQSRGQELTGMLVSSCASSSVTEVQACDNLCMCS